MLLVVATKVIILLQSLEAMSSKLVEQMSKPVYYQLKPLTHINKSIYKQTLRTETIPDELKKWHLLLQYLRGVITQNVLIIDTSFFLNSRETTHELLQ